MKEYQKSELAVISLMNTPSGRFAWWDDFPAQISEKLSARQIDHILFYASFTNHTRYKEHERRVATDENLNSLTWLIKNLVPLCRKYRKVIINTHSHYPPLKLWMIVWLMSNCEWHITEHRLGDSTPSRIKRCIKLLLRRVGVLPKHVICVSDSVKERNADIYGDWNLHTIHNGIRLDVYKRPNREVYKGDRTMKGLFVGRVHESKGVYQILEAYRILRNQKVDVSLTVVGDGTDLDGLKDYCEKYDLGELVEFAGYQSNTRPFYESHDFVLMPSIVKEAFSLVAIESKAMGLPVIYADTGGVAELFGRCESGLRLDSLTAEAIAEKVGLIRNDVNLYQHLVDRTEREMHLLSIDSMTDNYVKYYVKALGAEAGVVED
ncbi:MAG: glycosyltransferase family 4 protein [Motiliproteus sp.]|nr:glycosyltransferase family 4 protein [Motiliproteus sp.]MCW9052479.1 glycosyltransferase family 4 protein [Motiliproteus sp.]